MISDPIDRLRAANPEPSCPPPPIDEIWRRIEADDQGPHDGGVELPPGPAWSRARLRSLPSVIAVLVSVVVVLAVGAIALHSHGRGTPAATNGGAQELTSRLAVLRRPQTAADMLPSRLHIASPLSPPGRIIPRFTRLVRTLANARLYLVVTKWSPDSIWSTRLGDQVSIVAVRGTHATGTVPIPAADLSNANEVSLVSPTRQQLPSTPGLYYVGIVPDGVAHARWTFANNQLKPGTVLDASVADNVAVAQPRPDSPPTVLRAAWYAADGRQVATSNRALLAAQAARDAVQKAQAIRSDLQHSYHADPSLLAAYAVFDITSRTGVKTSAGDTISRPPLSALPLGVVQWPPPPGQLFQLDFTQVREAITPSGVHLYVIPGKRGLCLTAESSQSPFPDGLLAGGGGASCNLLPDVETRGIFMSGGSLGVTRTYRLLPKTIHSITVRTGSGQRTTIPVPDGIYVSPSNPTAQPPLRRCRHIGRPCPVR